MTERRRPSRRRTQDAAGQPSAETADLNPYRDDDAGVATVTAPEPSDAGPAPVSAGADAGATEAATDAPRRQRPARGPRRRSRPAGDESSAVEVPAGEAANGAPNGAAVNGAASNDAAADARVDGGASSDRVPQAGTVQAEAAPADAAPATPAPADVDPAGNGAAFTPRPQSQHGRPHPRHENRNQHPRHDRHEQGRPDRPQHERGPYDRGQQGGAAQGGAPHGAQNGAAQDGQPRRDFHEGGGRRQRHRQRGRFRDGNTGDFREQRQGPAAVVADTEVTGWVELARDGSGFVRQAANSYLAGPNDPFLPVGMVRSNNLRAGDGVVVAAGRDFRQRPVAVEVRSVNGAPPQPGVKRPDFQQLTAAFPDRKLKLETGKVAKSGPELTRRIVDLIAPLGFGQRALIVAPARSGKTMLLQALVEGVALNHPEATLIVLLVDERPEEVSEMVACGYGEVVASSFDMPADRHRDVVTMVMHRAQRLVEIGKDVVIVLDSITRMARAFNATKGVGRTLSGGLDAQAMATPKAFFGSARSVSPAYGGGSITIIGTALVETGSRMDDVIFEEFKGTGNCEIKLDRNLAEQRIFPAIDIPASGTRREDKLFRPDQLDAVYLLRRGLQQMPAAAAMNWLIKRIGSTPSNDVLLATLRDT